jgi:hypothetical protein
MAPYTGLIVIESSLTLALTKGAAKAASSAKGKINSPSKSASADRVLRRELDQALAVSPASALSSDSDESQEIVPKIIPPMSQRLSRVEHCTK